MKEQKKLDEAKYFYCEMVEKQGNRDKFIYNLSAFLSAARSVLQYALEEAKAKPGGRAWFDNISASSVLKFFKSKRDINIHEKPIGAKAAYEVTFRDTIGISDSLSITLLDKDGNIVQQFSSDKPETKPNEPETPEVRIRYYFDDWSGSEDIPTLCKEYVQQLECVIKDGVSKKFITG